MGSGTPRARPRPHLDSAATELFAEPESGIHHPFEVPLQPTSKVPEHGRAPGKNDVLEDEAEGSPWGGRPPTQNRHGQTPVPTHIPACRQTVGEARRCPRRSGCTPPCHSPPCGSAPQPPRSAEPARGAGAPGGPGNQSPAACLEENAAAQSHWSFGLFCLSRRWERRAL